MITLEGLLPLTQQQLFCKLSEWFKGAVTQKNEYIMVQGKAPIMLVAHLDTVHPNPVKVICKSNDGNILMSPQGIGGDDRCGVYALLAAYAQATTKPWLLFTCDEEKGGRGADAFCLDYYAKKLPKKLDTLKLIIEIDRRGSNDSVYYDCDNPKFTEYINGHGFKTASGSFSDISFIAPELGVAAVNLSSGYYNAHTPHEYINKNELSITINKVIQIVDDTIRPELPRYKYIKKVKPVYFDIWGKSAYGKCNWSGHNDIFDVEEINFDLSKIPVSIRDEYEMLLDFYTPEELEAIRAEQGDDAIWMMAEAEFGDGYYRIHNKDTEWEECKKIQNAD